MRDHLLLFLRADADSAHGRLRGRVITVFALSLALDALGSALILLFEHETSAVNNPWDAFFFTTTQLLTVSSQLQLPTTTGGRLVDIVLQVYAISVVASLAGLVTSFLHHRDTERRRDTSTAAADSDLP